MFLRKKRASFRKRFLAKYVFWLEAAGFTLIGILIAVMITSAIYEIDDVMKFSGAVAQPRRDSVMVSTESYVNAVFVDDSDFVEKGRELFNVTGSPDVAPLIKAIDSIQKAIEALQPDFANQDVQASLEKALDESLRALEKTPSKSITAPISGVFKQAGDIPWENLPGKVINGEVGVVITFDTLRFKAPVSGDNAPRVRINLLAEKDVADWKTLTRRIKPEQPPSDPVMKRIWELLENKLGEVKPGRRPLKRLMPEIVAALNEILRNKEFYDPDVWADKIIPDEAQELIAKKMENLHDDELIRLNRILLNAALPDSLKESENERQVVKAKLYVPVEEKGSGGKDAKARPKIFKIQGKAIHEPSGGMTVIELVNPPAEIVEYMKRRMDDPSLPPVTCSGNIVVGRISLFRFLFK